MTEEQITGAKMGGRGEYPLLRNAFDSSLSHSTADLLASDPSKNESGMQYIFCRQLSISPFYIFPQHPHCNLSQTGPKKKRFIRGGKNLLACEQRRRNPNRTLGVAGLNRIRR